MHVCLIACAVFLRSERHLALSADMFTLMHISYLKKAMRKESFFFFKDLLSLGSGKLMNDYFQY